jgi:hypothetical protein
VRFAGHLDEEKHLSAHEPAFLTQPVEPVHANP